MNYFVTGGSRGIGAEIVKQAVREGHDVAFTYLGSADAAKAVQADAAGLREGARCKAYQLDVRDPAMVEAVGNQVLEDFEQVDVVVNNAGINRGNLAVYTSDEEWHDVLATNLSGAFYVSRCFLPGMLANRFGRIINISSVVKNGMAGQAAYSASKAGLIGLTRSLAKEYGPKNITVNAIVAGYFKTDMTEEYMSDSFKAFWFKYCPLRRTGELSEVSRVVTFLASEAAAFITGAEIPVAGGLEEGG